MLRRGLNRGLSGRVKTGLSGAEGAMSEEREREDFLESEERGSSGVVCFLMEAGARARLKLLVDESVAVFHPDTANTYACWQFVLEGGFDVWINARNGLPISAGRVINKV